MRVLFATWAWPSHLYPMVPLAWAFRAAGHEVRVASQPGLGGVIQSCGLPAVAVGSDVDAPAIVREYVLGPGSAPIRNTKGPRAMSMFSTLAEAMFEDLAAYACAWQPDLLVYEPTTLAGPVAARAAGIPAIRFLYGLDLLSGARALLPKVVQPLCRRLGIDGVDPLGDLTVDPCPASFQMRSSPGGQAVRYVPFNGSGAAPAWLLEETGRPRVCVTWGTTMAKLGDDLFLAGRVIDALRSLDVEIVAAIAPAQRRLLPPAADEARVVESLPLSLLLPTCDLVVHHGGAGTMLTSLANGLPQLVVPQLPDHSLHSQQLARTGAGEVLGRQEATTQRIREAAGALLHSRPHRDAAERLRQEIAARPAPADIVAPLADRASQRMAVRT